MDQMSLLDLGKSWINVLSVGITACTQNSLSILLTNVIYSLLE